MFSWNDPLHVLYHLKEIWSETVKFEQSYDQNSEKFVFCGMDLGENT